MLATMENGQNGCEYFRTLEMMRERVNNGDSKNYALHLCCGQKIFRKCVQHFSSERANQPQKFYDSSHTQLLAIAETGGEGVIFPSEIRRLFWKM